MTKANLTRDNQYNPLELVESLLKRLSKKEADILRRRFGLRENSERPETPKETLERIGGVYSITRERVRQIQNQSVSKLKKSLDDSGHRELIDLIEKTVASLIREHGGIMEEGHLLEKMLEGKSDDNLSRQASVFLMSEILSDDIQKMKPTGDLKTSWKTGMAQVDFFRKTVREMVKIFKAANRPLPTEELLALVKQSDLYMANRDKLSDAVILSYLKATRAIKRNAFGELGLSSWQTITPRRISDKIYLIFKKYGKPLHFTEIAKLINDHDFDKKKAHPATVHNELILDKGRCVLIGRGIYALKEWGYKAGVIADILADILKSRAKPMGKEELAEEALKQRIIRKETVFLALMNKEKFQRTSDGKYLLAED